ncbi:MAG: proline racemase family protein [bacterium]|nr:proline racemase family protein [bacterium]
MIDPITTIDGHTAGEPLRVVTSGWPLIPGASMLEKRRFAREHHDHLRRRLMWEPRGHADMYGCLLVEPVTRDGDVGVLFLHNEGFSTMCGHGIIGLVKIGIEHGLVAHTDGLVRIDTPAGRVTAQARMDGDTVLDVSFENVPSFVLVPDGEVEVDGIGRVRFDLAYGGAFYAYVDADAIGLDLAAANTPEIIAVGMRIKHAVMAKVPIAHPDGDDDLNFLYGTIFVRALDREVGGEAHSRNVCVFADGEVDRSPTGTGVSGRAAIHHHRGELELGERITIESVIGTTFDVAALRTTVVGAFDAIVPKVAGTAFVTGKHQFVTDPRDPLADGFFLR